MMVSTKVTSNIKGAYSASMVVYNMAFWMLITSAFSRTIRALVGNRSKLAKEKVWILRYRRVRTM